MRQAYQTRLADLSDHGARMCQVAADTMRDATRSLLDVDLALAERVIASDVMLDEMRASAEEVVLELLALQSPVATDLRSVVSALWIVADVQRMGTLAIHVAKAARRRHPMAVLPNEIRPTFERMGSVAVHLADQATVILRDRDIDLARGARAAEDDLMDDLHKEMFAALMSPTWSHGVQAAVDISLLGRFYERFGDHAVAVARRVIFLVTGENVGGDTTVYAHQRARAGTLSSIDLKPDLNASPDRALTGRSAAVPGASGEWRVEPAASRSDRRCSPRWPSRSGSRRSSWSSSYSISRPGWPTPARLKKAVRSETRAACCMLWVTMTMV